MRLFGVILHYCDCVYPLKKMEGEEITNLPFRCTKMKSVKPSLPPKRWSISMVCVFSVQNRIYKCKQRRRYFKTLCTELLLPCPPLLKVCGRKNELTFLSSEVQPQFLHLFALWSNVFMEPLQKYKLFGQKKRKKNTTASLAKLSQFTSSKGLDVVFFSELTSLFWTLNASASLWYNSLTLAKSEIFLVTLPSCASWALNSNSLILQL